jgi:hypothetical protein
VSSRDGAGALSRHDVATRHARSVLVVWLPPRRFAPPDGVLGLLHPNADHGVHRVAASAVRHACLTTGAFPPVRCPPEPSPPATAAPASPQVRAPLSFRSMAVARHFTRDFEALLRRGVRGLRVLLPTHGDSMLSWASSFWIDACRHPEGFRAPVWPTSTARRRSAQRHRATRTALGMSARSRACNPGSQARDQQQGCLLALRAPGRSQVPSDTP